MKRELRVKGVRAPVGPTLDAITSTGAGSVAIEAKVAEPSRSAPKVVLQRQRDALAAAVWPGTIGLSRRCGQGNSRTAAWTPHSC
jgi:hypothetical protein